MTRHSKKLAEAIAQTLNVRAENIKKNPILQDVDLLFVVGGIYGGESKPELVEFVKRLDSSEIKRAVLVTSSATKKQGQKTIRALLVDKGIEVLGETICQGSFLFMSFGHPNQVDVDEVVRYANKVAEKVGVTI
jgi:hypothetical protein